MAKNNSNLVSVGKPVATGVVCAATIGTPLPTDATSPLDDAFIKHGYISSDGLTNSTSTDTTDITAFGGDTVLTVQTSRTETFTWTFIQSADKDVLAEVYGQDNVSVDTGMLKVTHNGKTMPRRIFVYELLLTGGRVKRILVPNGQITEVGDVVYQDGEAIGYEVTVTAYPDADGNTAIEWITGIE
ncbi:phage tail protein [Actinobaculum sp. 352]|uniref:phage tail tube protein n=1 Tax=Actinobaculum sp. 352 TaxID=2490946 RepID=UPI000F7D9542|nr:phage tail protein [Actinobaculum sp. 352]RTE47731.1 phage tail protein [Actinobaculum sp. 352]